MRTSEKKNKSFQDIIDEYTQYADEEGMEFLPFCHTTTQGYASDIILSHMKPQKCQVYDEDLTYFFYGKANYLVDEELDNYTDDPPITFLYNSKTIIRYSIRRILPFDSGGFDRYGFKKGFVKGNYTYMCPNLKMILAYIRLVYESNESYLTDNVSMNELKKHESYCLQIKHMIDMYDNMNQGRLKSGPQLFSIEVQFSEAIDFEPSHVIIPYDFYTQPYWSTNLMADHPNVQIEHYGEEEILANAGRSLQASEYQRLMRAKVKAITSQFLAQQQQKAS